jgi:hypothetical protein
MRSVWTDDKPTIRVFPRRTSYTPDDDYCFIGYPPLMFRPPNGTPVHVSCCFTWDIPLAYKLRDAWNELYFPYVQIGGPAIKTNNGVYSMPGLYVKPEVIFTSTGCNNQCPWCLVHLREGDLQERTPIIPAIRSNPIIQDNNLLQCSRPHLEKVFDLLRFYKRISFNGGLDCRLVTDWIADRLRGLDVYQMFLACDTKQEIRDLRNAMAKIGKVDRRKARCYVLLAYDSTETVSDATERLEQVWETGCMPFAQLYQPPDRYIKYSQEWRDLARTWSRPAAMQSIHKKGVT